jgi:hypothetical protein
VPLFMLTYDRSSATLMTLEVITAGRESEAFQRRLAAEVGAFRDGMDVEVVILEADSEESLRRTHARYFEDLGDLLDAARADTSFQRDSKHAADLPEL